MNDSQPTDEDNARQEKIDSAIAEYMEAVDEGLPFDPQEWLQRHKDISEELRTFLADEKQLVDANLSSSVENPSRGALLHSTDAKRDPAEDGARTEPVQQPSGARAADGVDAGVEHAGSAGAEASKREVEQPHQGHGDSDQYGATLLEKNSGSASALNSADASDFGSYPLGSQTTSDSSELRSVGGYRLQRLLGAGGMGQVYQAVDPSGNSVAVKLLSARLRRSDESLQRFRQEGQIASTINHPRCVFVRAADEDRGQPYIVMELMTGKTLKDLRQEQGPLSVARAVEAILDVLDGLEEAHSHGMIHRDIKPANCYLESNGRVKVGDFGLARSMVSDSELTQTGDFIGTPLFASPEQVKGQAVDERTDIYSVCATLYYLLTGRAPFAGSSPTTVIARIVSEDPQPARELNREVPEQLDQIVLQGLSRNRSQRFQTVTELKQALEPFVQPQNSISVWGRRFAAFGLESLAIGLIGTVISLLLLPPSGPAIVPLGLYLCLMLPVILYYTACEGWWKASLGKRLLRLQIVDQKTGQPPARWRLLLRTIISLMLMGVLSDLLMYAFYSPQNVESWFILQWTLYMASYCLMLSPLLRGSGRRMLLQDWLTRTRVSDRPIVSRQQQLAGTAARYHVPLLAATGYSSLPGEYSIQGLICSSEEASPERHCAVLAGRDGALSRDVWLHLRPLSESPLSAARRDCARTARLRWLRGGRTVRWQWDAYLACQGAPLKHWTAPGSALTWKETRAILSQLTEEIDQSVRENTWTHIRSLDQVWMDSRGRITILDWSSEDGVSTKVRSLSESPSDIVQPDAQNRQDALPLTSDHCALLRECARLALCGTSRPLNEAGTPVRAVVPLHAQELLTSLVTGHTKDGRRVTTAGLRAALDESRRRPTEANLESRLLGLGVAVLTCSLMLGLVASLSRLGNQVMLSSISDHLLLPAAAEWLAAHPDQSEADSKPNPSSSPSATEQFPAPSALKTWLSESDSRQQRLREEYQVRYTGLGRYTSAIAAGTGLVEDPMAQLPQVSFEWDKNELIAVNWTQTGRREALAPSLFTRAMRMGTEVRAEEMLRRHPRGLFVITLFPFLSWMIWTGLTRGGISMWISGLRVVGPDGIPIRWYVHLLRSLLMLSPMMLIQFVITFIDLFHPQQLWVSMFLYQTLMGLFAVYAMLTIAFPRRAPQDWLLGTSLVPR